MTESERLTFKTDVGISIEKNEDCPTCSICWNCDSKVKDCNYFNDAVERLAMYEDIGTVSEFRELKEKATAKKPKLEQVEIDYYEYDCLECPNCGGFIGYATECEEEHYQIGYCPCCGQKLDWSEGKE